MRGYTATAIRTCMLSALIVLCVGAVSSAGAGSFAADQADALPAGKASNAGIILVNAAGWMETSGKAPSGNILWLTVRDHTVFLKGILSLVQIAFLPGLVIVLLLGLNDGLLRTVVLSFGLSMIFNYHIVTLLVLLGIYKSSVVYGIFLVELLLLLYVSRRWLSAPISVIFSHDAIRMGAFLGDLRQEDAESRIHSVVTFAAAGIAIVGCLAAAAGKIGSTFEHWDAVVSWNPWAVEWSQNRMPYHTWGYYPQLLPANWSLSYVFLSGSELQFFPKAVALLFAPAIVLLMLDLGMRKRDRGFFLAAAATAYLLFAFLGCFVTSGYADVPVAFFGVAALYAILPPGTDETGETKRISIVLCGLLCAAGAITKQAGLYLVVAFPVMAYLVAWKDNPTMTTGDRVRAFCLCALTAIAVAVPWYVYKFILLFQGHERGNIEYLLVGIHGGRTLAERFVHGMSMLINHMGMIPFLVFFPATTLAGLICKKTRGLVLVVIIPYFLIWALGFSYDGRNLAFVLPFLGITFGLSLEHLIIRRGIARPSHLFGWIMQIKLGHAMVIALLLAGLASWLLPAGLLHKLHFERLQNRADPINALLYRNYETKRLYGKVLTNYQIMAHLPILKDMYEYQYFGDLARLRSGIRKKAPDFLLYSGPREPGGPVYQYIMKKIERGDLEIVDKAGGTLLLKVVRGDK